MPAPFLFLRRIEAAKRGYRLQACRSVDGHPLRFLEGFYLRMGGPEAVLVLHVELAEAVSRKEFLISIKVLKNNDTYC